MAWRTIPGLQGKVYVPEHFATEKKNPCPDCFVCQKCSDDRCMVCRCDRLDRRRKIEIRCSYEKEA
jgi:hypothetical protein